jgi:hypothetical protein
MSSQPKVSKRVSKKLDKLYQSTDAEKVRVILKAMDEYQRFHNVKSMCIPNSTILRSFLLMLGYEDTTVVPLIGIWNNPDTGNPLLVLHMVVKLIAPDENKIMTEYIIDASTEWNRRKDEVRWVDKFATVEWGTTSQEFKKDALKRFLVFKKHEDKINSSKTTQFECMFEDYSVEMCKHIRKRFPLFEYTNYSHTY